MQILAKGPDSRDYYMRSTMSESYVRVAVYNTMHLSLTAEWPKHITHLSL